MLRVLLVLIAVALAPTLPSAALTAQTAAAPADSIFEVRLRDGSVLYGRIVESTAERLVLVTVAGVRMEIPATQVERTRLTTGRARDGAYWAEDPNATRLLFSSTARPLAKGEGYVSSFLFVLPFAAYGVTDRFTIAGGTPIIPELIGRVWYLAPKYTLVQQPRASFAVGGLGFINTAASDEGSVGVLYGVGTFGSTDNAVSVGAGWGYATAAGSSSGLSSDPVIMLGGERRISRRVKLVSENWVYAGRGEAGGLFSGGVRFIGDRLSADLGLGGVAGGGSSSGFCCVPLVNFVWNFGGQ